jgi:hypothetical protein
MHGEQWENGTCGNQQGSLVASEMQQMSSVFQQMSDGDRKCWDGLAGFESCSTTLPGSWRAGLTPASRRPLAWCGWFTCLSPTSLFGHPAGVEDARARLLCLFLTPKGVGGSAGVNMSLGQSGRLTKGTEARLLIAVSGDQMCQCTQRPIQQRQAR